ncbi:MAG: hypothetical protein EXS63_07180 [Candidatus Omnitrophica bacterium]|nr:hypothetical protein [Candidatus Omnitrophota bacterium]
MLLTATAMGAAAVYGWSRWVEPRWFQINHHQILVEKTLHKPLRILHLSDIHFAEHNPHLFRFFDRLGQEEVDLIFVTGDIIDLDEGIDRCIYNLKKLRPAQGIYAVMGNHDHYRYEVRDTIMGNFFGEPHPATTNDVKRLVRELQTMGVHVLTNESQTIEYHGTSLRIHGVDDPTTGKADVEAVRKNLMPGKMNLLLTHSVDALAAFEEGEIDVSFSGHSHGGQIRFPWIGAIFKHTRMGRHYVDGIKKLKGTHCAISRGIHAGRSIRNRLLCPPEAILLEIRNSHH